MGLIVVKLILLNADFFLALHSLIALILILMVSHGNCSFILYTNFGSTVFHNSCSVQLQLSKPGKEKKCFSVPCSQIQMFV